MGEAGLATMRELLERKQLVTREEWELLWGRRRDQRLLALEKRDRFQRSRERILALHHGRRQDEFLRFLEEASKAFSALELERAIEALEGAARPDRGKPELGRLPRAGLFPP